MSVRNTNAVVRLVLDFMSFSILVLFCFAGSADQSRSLASFNDLLQNLQPRRLYRSHASSRHEPKALVLSAAVDDLNVIVRRRVMERGTGVLGDEAEELFPPRVIDKREDSLAYRLQFLNADSANASGNGFAPGFGDFLHVYGIEWHNVRSAFLC
jgi:hypothetical protein